MNTAPEELPIIFIEHVLVTCSTEPLTLGPDTTRPQQRRTWCDRFTYRDFTPIPEFHTSEVRRCRDCAKNAPGMAVFQTLGHTIAEAATVPTVVSK